jgi:hypothetical protein
VTDKERQAIWELLRFVHAAKQCALVQRVAAQGELRPINGTTAEVGRSGDYKE